MSDLECRHGTARSLPLPLVGRGLPAEGGLGEGFVKDCSESERPLTQPVLRKAQDRRPSPHKGERGRVASGFKRR